MNGDARSCGTILDADPTHMYPPAVSAEGHWIRQEVPTQNHLIDLDFVDRLHGWAVGVNGIVLCTTDGGENWEIQQSPDTSLYLAGVDFVGVRTGWIVGSSREDPFVACTHDGGKTWTRQMVGLLEPYSYPESVAFLDTQTGWSTTRWDEKFGPWWTNIKHPVSILSSGMVKMTSEVWCPPASTSIAWM